MIKISPFIVPAVIISYFTGFINEYIIMFLVLLLHEAGHLLSIRRHSVEIESITVQPFGISISIPDEFFENPYDEIPVAIAGPVMSILTGALVLLAEKLIFPGNKYALFFAVSSIFLGSFNLLPAYPADGGRVLKAYLSLKHGYIKSYNAVMRLTGYISLFLIASGILVFIKTNFNFTFCLTGCFLMYGILTQKNHSSKYLKKELESYRKKSLGKKLPVRRIAIDGKINAIGLLNDLSPGCYCIFEIIEGFRKKREITEGELLDAMLKKGTNISAKDIYNSTN